MLYEPLTFVCWCHITDILLQENNDCVNLACYHGNLEVVRELVDRQKVDPHTVSEVCARTDVYEHSCPPTFCVLLAFCTTPFVTSGCKWLPCKGTIFCS